MATMAIVAGTSSSHPCPPIHSHADHHPSDEPMFDDDDVGQEEYYDPEVLDDTYPDRTANEDNDDNIVTSGDAAAAAAAAATSAAQRKKSHKDLKVPDNERRTTPYMTKYERARILGTRALQIRWAICAAEGECGGWRTG